MMVMPGPQIRFRIVRFGARWITLIPARSGSPSAAITSSGSLTARATTSRTNRWVGSAVTALWQSAKNRSRSNIGFLIGIQSGDNYSRLLSCRSKSVRSDQLPHQFADQHVGHPEHHDKERD